MNTLKQHKLLSHWAGQILAISMSLARYSKFELESSAVFVVLVTNIDYLAHPSLHVSLSDLKPRLALWLDHR